MFLTHIAERLFNQPLLLLPEYHSVVLTALADRLNIEPQVSREVVERYERPASRPQITQNGIAVLPIVGGMVHRGGNMEAASGIQSYTQIQNTLMGYLDNSKVRGVLLDLDTPGGEVAGLAELAKFIQDMSAIERKPVWAIANTLAASAGYWLGSSADRFYAAPNARVGSIGVVVAHHDMSKAMEKKGVNVSFIHAGKMKVAGNSFGPLPDDVRAEIQARVDSLWDQFAGYVAERRDITADAVKGFEARVFTANEAQDLDLVDGVGTLGEVLQAFGTYLNRPFGSEGQSIGENMSKENLLYGASDIQAARDEGRAAGLKEGQEAAAVAANAEFAKSITALFPESKRASAFAEALTDGASLALATKLAVKIDDPKPAAAAPDASATRQDVDRLLAAHAPNVASDDAQNTADPRAKRLAELSANVGSYSTAKGYRAGA